MSLHLAGLLDVLRAETAYKQLLAALADGQEGARSTSCARRGPIWRRRWRGTGADPILYLTAAVRRAYNVSEQLPLWLDDPARLHRFAEPSALFYDRAPWEPTVIRSRLATLSALAEVGGGEAPPIIVSSARALMQATLPPSQDSPKPLMKSQSASGIRWRR